MYLGAKHMVTGYDHLLFLVGVIFFLYKPRDIILYVSLFTLGHSITLLAGVLLELEVNVYLIDAIIGLSVVYKAFENIDGFKQILGFQFDTRIAVFLFGLCHGLGLASKLQEFALSIAERILRISVREQDSTIIATIEEALQRAVKSDEFTIFIHPEDYETVAENSTEIVAGLTGLNKIVIKKDITVERGGAKIESDNCTIDATIASQLDVIREEIKKNL
jgi:hypothetical protein